MSMPVTRARELLPARVIAAMAWPRAIVSAWRVPLIVLHWGAGCLIRVWSGSALAIAGVTRSEAPPTLAIILRFFLPRLSAVVAIVRGRIVLRYLFISAGSGACALRSRWFGAGANAAIVWPTVAKATETARRLFTAFVGCGRRIAGFSFAKVAVAFAASLGAGSRTARVY